MINYYYSFGRGPCPVKNYFSRKMILEFSTIYVDNDGIHKKNIVWQVLPNLTDVSLKHGEIRFATLLTTDNTRKTYYLTKFELCSFGVEAFICTYIAHKMNLYDLKYFGQIQG